MEKYYLRHSYFGGTKTTMLEFLYNNFSEADKLNENNLVVVCYLTDRELQKRNLSLNTMHLYRTNGFNYIIQHCAAMNVFIYYKHIVNKIVADGFTRFEKGEICFAAAKDLRRVAAMVEEFYLTKSLTWHVLSPLKKRIPTDEFHRAVEAFRNHQTKNSNLVPVSIRSICNAVSKFLCKLEDKGYLSFNQLNLAIISSEVIEYSKNYRNNGIRKLLYNLRKFFSVLAMESKCEFTTVLNLSLAIPRTAVLHKYVKKGFSSEQIKAILKTIPTSSCIGKRDFAMILLGAITGLRACDITALKMGDIDWRKEEITIIQSKTKKTISLPLITEVGNAVCDYILNGRPKSNSPYVFLPFKKPYRKMTSDGIGGRLRQYILQANIIDSNQDMGFHNLRRALSNRMLRSEISFVAIGEILGHSAISSVRPYLSADTEGLRACDIPLSLIARKGDKSERYSL